MAEISPGVGPLRFDNSYARLPERFFARVSPAIPPTPALVRVNAAVADALGLDPAFLRSAEGVGILSGAAIPAGAEPLAMAYGGHQFGNWSPQLGDGRAILLGEVIDRAGVRRDIQLKGSGRTPFSRMGDGRAVLGPVLREYILGAAMAALGVPTTLSLAAVTTGERVIREGVKPGAVLTRIATSHVRIGTFEYFANRGDVEGVRILADYVIGRLYPELADSPRRYRGLLDAVIARTAALIARWMLIGFIHGVMNTDNMSIAGETIDYGPCAFMDSYHPATVYSSIDAQGRYAYANQPRIAHWNLSRLAGALLSLLAPDKDAAIAEAQDALDAFPGHFQSAYAAGLCAKLGFAQTRAGDLAIAQDLLETMARNHADFTLTFRRLGEAANSGPDRDGPVRILFDDAGDFDRWAQSWRRRLADQDGSEPERQAAMRAVNPAFIPRNHQVQAVIAAAEERSDYAKLDEMMTVLAAPYDDQPDFAAYAEPPRPEEVVHQTFCGT